MNEMDVDDAGGQNIHQGAGSSNGMGADTWLTLRDDHRIILYALVSLALVIGGHRTWREYHRYRENAARRAKIHRLVESSRREKEKERERKAGSLAVEAVVDNSHPPLSVAAATAKSITHDDHAVESNADSSKSLASSASAQDLKARPENATSAKRNKDRRKRGRDVYKEVPKQDRKKPQSSVSSAPPSPSSPHHPNSINAQASESDSLLQVQAAISDVEASRSRSRSRSRSCSSSRNPSHSYSRVRSDSSPASASGSRSCVREQFGGAEVVEEVEAGSSSENTPKPDSEAQTLFTESTFRFDLPPSPQPTTQREYRDTDGQSDCSSSSVPPDFSIGASSIPNSQTGNAHIDESNFSTTSGQQGIVVSDINGVATTTDITMIRRNDFKISRTPTPPLTLSGPSSTTSTSEPTSGSSSIAVSVSGFEGTNLAGGGGTGAGSPVLRSYNFDFELDVQFDPRADDPDANTISISQPIPSVPSGKSQPVWLGLRDGDESRNRSSSCPRARHESEGGVGANDAAMSSKREHAPKTPSSSSFSSISVSDPGTSASVTSVSVSATSSSSAWAETKERISGTSSNGNTILGPGQRFNELRRVSKRNNSSGKSKSPPPPRFRSLSRPSASASGSGSGSGSGSRSRGSPYHSNSLPLPLPLPLPMTMTSLSAGVSPSSTPPPYTPGSGIGAGLGGAFGYRAASESAIRRREAEQQRREVERYKSEIESVRSRWCEDVERGRRREAELQAQLQLVTSQMHALSLTISQMQLHPHSFPTHPPPPFAALSPHMSRSQNARSSSTPNLNGNSNPSSQQQPQTSHQQPAYSMPPYSYPNVNGQEAAGSPLSVPPPPHIPMPYLSGTAMYPSMYAYPFMSALPPHSMQRSTSGSGSGSQSNSGDAESEGAGSVNENRSRGRNRNSKTNGRTNGDGGRSGNASPTREYEYEYEYDHDYDYGNYYAFASPPAGPFDFSGGFGYGMWPGRVENVNPDSYVGVGEERDTTTEQGDADEEGKGPSAASAGGGSLGMDVGEGVSEELVEAILKRPGSINLANTGVGRSPSVPTPRRTWSGNTRSASANSGVPPLNPIGSAGERPNAGGVEGRASSEGFTFASLSELGNPQPRRRSGDESRNENDDVTEEKAERKGDWLVFETKSNAGVDVDASEESSAQSNSGAGEGTAVEVPLVASPEREEAHALNSLVLDPDSGKRQPIEDEEGVRVESGPGSDGIDATVNTVVKDGEGDCVTSDRHDQPS